MRFTNTLAVILVSTGVSACIPYTVGTTAQPVAPGNRTTSMIVYAAPAIVDTSADPSRPRPLRGTGRMMIDGEARIGIDDRSDYGLRLVAASGLVVNYKRLVTDPRSDIRFAIMPGVGIVNWGDHVYTELTMLWSLWEPPTQARNDSTKHWDFVPYGGFKVSKVLPVNEVSVEDGATYGGFVGMRFGTTRFGISPEIGAFRDPSALGLRKKSLVFVPAIVVHGREFMDLLGELPTGIFGGRGRRYGDSRRPPPRVLTQPDLTRSPRLIPSGTGCATSVDRGLTYMGCVP